MSPGKVVVNVAVETESVRSTASAGKRKVGAGKDALSSHNEPGETIHRVSLTQRP